MWRRSVKCFDWKVSTDLASYIETFYSCDKILENFGPKFFHGESYLTFSVNFSTIFFQELSGEHIIFIVSTSLDFKFYPGLCISKVFMVIDI